MAKLSYSQAIRETIAQEMRRDERVFVMGEDVEKLGGVYGCTRDLYKEFGTDRVRNTPISESAIIGAAQFSRMKEGVLFLNLARGHVVDVGALAQAMGSGRVAGAAVDVFPEEPRTNADPFESPLQGLKNMILTPHIGGSTEEAQEAIAEFAAERLLGYLNRGDTTFSVNLPNVQLAEVSGAHRLLHIHRNQPGVLAELNQALAAAGLNILGQHLKTSERVGYVITDVDRDYDREALGVLKAVPGTLKFRTLH